MDLAQQQQLFAQYPRAFRRPSVRYSDVGHDQLAAEEPCPLDFWGIECGPGWLPLINAAAAAMEAEIDKLAGGRWPVTIWPRIGQIKQKFGTLAVYVSGMRPAGLVAALDAAANASRTVCEECGAPGELRTDGGYMHVTCAKCATRPAPPLPDDATTDQRLMELRAILDARPDFASNALLNRLRQHQRTEINALLSETADAFAARALTEQPALTLLPLNNQPTAVIAGTRLPVQALFKAIASGQSLGDFCAAHPEVSPGQAALLVFHASQLLAESAK